MRRAILASALAGFLAGGGAAAGAVASVAPAPRVPMMVAGRAHVLGGPRTVVARATTVPASGHRCAVGAGTPLAALAALRRAGGPGFHVRDFGGCSARSPAASESLYVDRIGPDRARGADGWVYKVGRRAPGVGAGSPGIRARAGQPVLWFYCRMGATGCQRTLALTAASQVTAGAPVRLTVRGYDDRGRGVAVAGTQVTLGAATATTGADGGATLTAPASRGRYRATATATGLVPAFPVEVTVT